MGGELRRRLARLVMSMTGGMDEDGVDGWSMMGAGKISLSVSNGLGS